MRGTLQLALRRGSVGRIIPADAGNTLTGLRGVRTGEDHPRGCGEHPLDGVVTNRQWGSSPRMRGTHEHAKAELETLRIIPADAGNTGSGQDRRLDRTDHPRGCGEHLSGITPQVETLGSSPRMRGTPALQPRLGLVHGIIPADAGNTPPPLHRI